MMETAVASFPSCARGCYLKNGVILRHAITKWKGEICGPDRDCGWLALTIDSRSVKLKIWNYQTSRRNLSTSG